MKQFLLVWGNWQTAEEGAEWCYDDTVQKQGIDYFLQSNNYSVDDMETIRQLKIGENHVAVGGNHMIIRIQ
jgi:hypothetical protein